MRCCAVTVLLLYCKLAFSQNIPVRNTAITLKRAIEINHVAPRMVDDRFSADLFDQFFQLADPDNLFLTQSDIASFQVHRSQLDDELNHRGWSFLHAVFPVLKKRMQQADSLVLSGTDKAFDFTTPDKVAAGFTDLRATGEPEWKKRWQQLLKYEVWKGLSAQIQPGLQQEAAVKNTVAKEPQVRARVRDRHHKQLSYLLANDAAVLRSETEQNFLTAIAKCFDPHTHYFNPSAKKSFTGALDTEGLYFGFTLGDNEKDEVVIRQLMPGSPAWKSGQLNKDDVFLQMQWEGGEAVDLSAATAQEVNEMIDAVHGKRLLITVRKANASVLTVTLQREKVENEDEFVKSFVLSGTRKIGYIYLPSFYTTWETGSGSSCASDMAKEIVKLKKEGIEGLILDVRFNGGGSLQEAIELTGIFIEDGPLGQLRTREGKAISLKDVNRGTVWDGPLLLMVNGQSASASEMIAAALQDYNRALVVGSTTHGKATAQQFIPLDTFSKSGMVHKSSQDHLLKVTNGKLYRVTGKTAQGIGVQPDILLPDLYARFSEFEHQLFFYVKPDTIQANSWYKPLPPIPFSEIKAKSVQRLTSSQKFATLASWIEKNDGFHRMPEQLSMDAMFRNRERAKELQQQERLIKQPSTAYRAGNHSFERLISDISKETNQRWLDRIVSDPYIEECYFIISDLITTTQSKKEL